MLERDPAQPAGSWRYERIEAAGRWLRLDAPDRVSRLLPDFPGSVPADAAAAPGARFRGRNRSGWLRWSRTCEVLAVDPPRQIAWRTISTPLFADATNWCIALEPADAGTRIVETFQVTRCPRWWEWVVTRVNPRHIDRSAALADDLHRIGSVAAADARRARSGTQIVTTAPQPQIPG